MFYSTEEELHGDIMADFNPSNLPSSGPTLGVPYLSVEVIADSEIKQNGASAVQGGGTEMTQGT